MSTLAEEDQLLSPVPLKMSLSSPSVTQPINRTTMSPGYTHLWYPNEVRGEMKSELQELLDNAPNLATEELSPFINYISTALSQRKRMSVAKAMPTKQFLTKFTLFGKLPPELQCIIWSEALPGPRTIPISANCINIFQRPKETRLRHLEVLNIARVNYQASSVVMHRFSKIEARFHCHEIGTAYPQTYFVDWSHDIFYLASEPSWWHVNHAYLGAKYTLQRAKNIALRIDNFWWLKDAKAWIPAVQMAVEKLIFVADCEGFLDGLVRTVGGAPRKFVEKADDGLESVIRTRVEEEPDHPILEAMKREIAIIGEVLGNEEVKKVFGGVETTFEIWRRPGQLDGELW